MQFPQPRQVTGISEDGKFVFVDGSTTGLPVDEVRVVEATPVVPASGMTNAAKPLMNQRGFKQDVYTLGDEGQVILQWPEKMSQESYDEFVDWIDLQLRKIARLSGIKTKEKK